MTGSAVLQVSLRTGKKIHAEMICSSSNLEEQWFVDEALPTRGQDRVSTGRDREERIGDPVIDDFKVFVRNGEFKLVEACSDRQPYCDFDFG